MRLHHVLPVLVLFALPIACDKGEDTVPPEPDFGPPEPAPADDGPLEISQWHEGPIKVMLSLGENAVVAPEGTNLKLEVFSDREKFPPMGVVFTKEMAISGPGPFAFEFEFPKDQYDTANPYGVSAMAFDAEGTVFYMSQPVSIFKWEEPKEVYQLQLDPAAPAAAKPE